MLARTFCPFFAAARRIKSHAVHSIFIRCTIGIWPFSLNALAPNDGRKNGKPFNGPHLCRPNFGAADLSNSNIERAPRSHLQRTDAHAHGANYFFSAEVRQSHYSQHCVLVFSISPCSVQFDCDLSESSVPSPKRT